MKIRSKQILTLYFNSWWFPAVFFLAVLAVFTMVAVAQWRPLAIVANVLLVSLGIAFLGILSVSIWNLIKNRWTKAVVNLVMLPVCGVVAFSAFGFLMFALLLGPSEDGFADNLTIPEDITLSEPKQELDTEPGGPEDTFQAALLTVLKIPGSSDVSVTADITSLVRLQRQSPDILKRYLATSLSWRVFREHGGIFATRRWMVGSEWRYDLHGYYSRHDIDMWSKAGIPDFQSRFTIGFSGKPWARFSGDATKMKVGERRPLTLSIRNQNTKAVASSPRES